MRNYQGKSLVEMLELLDQDYQDYLDGGENPGEQFWGEFGTLYKENQTFAVAALIQGDLLAKLVNLKVAVPVELSWLRSERLWEFGIDIHSFDSCWRCALYLENLANGSIEVSQEVDEILEALEPSLAFGGASILLQVEKSRVWQEALRQETISTENKRKIQLLLDLIFAGEELILDTVFETEVAPEDKLKLLERASHASLVSYLFDEDNTRSNKKLLEQMASDQGMMELLFLDEASLNQEIVEKWKNRVISLFSETGKNDATVVAMLQQIYLNYPAIRGVYVRFLLDRLAEVRIRETPEARERLILKNQQLIDTFLPALLIEKTIEAADSGDWYSVQAISCYLAEKFHEGGKCLPNLTAKERELFVCWRSCYILETLKDGVYAQSSKFQKALLFMALKETDELLDGLWLHYRSDFEDKMNNLKQDMAKLQEQNVSELELNETLDQQRASILKQYVTIMDFYLFMERSNSLAEITRWQHLEYDCNYDAKRHAAVLYAFIAFMDILKPEDIKAMRPELDETAAKVERIHCLLPLLEKLQHADENTEMPGRQIKQYMLDLYVLQVPEEERKRYPATQQEIETAARNHYNQTKKLDYCRTLLGRLNDQSAVNDNNAVLQLRVN